MAEEAAEESEGEGGGGSGDGGSVLKKYGPLAAIVMLAQAVIAFLIIEFVLKENMPEEPEVPLIPQMTSETIRQSGGATPLDRLPFLYASDELKTITANPAGTNSERFVVLSVQWGLEAFNEDGEDITGELDTNAAVTDKIGLYDLKIKSLIMRIIRGKTVDELDARFQDELEDEIRKVVNTQIFDRLFKTGDEEENTTTVNVVEVNISDIIIQ